MDAFCALSTSSSKMMSSGLFLYMKITSALSREESIPDSYRSAELRLSETVGPVLDNFDAAVVLKIFWPGYPV